MPGFGVAQELRGAGSGFLRPLCRAAKDIQCTADPRLLGQQFEQSAATADLDIVGVGTQAEDRSQRSEKTVFA